MTSNLNGTKTLIIGGVKSGKSGYAEKKAEHIAQEQNINVCLIATATADDDEMKNRIDRHKRDRKDDWLVMEEPLALARALDQADLEESKHCIVVDCLTLWVTNLLMTSDDALLRREMSEFLLAVERCQSPLLLVSNETNMGVTPLGELSRRFCDETGLLHQAMGSRCDNVTLMVAGIPTPIKGSAAHYRSASLP